MKPPHMIFLWKMVRTRTNLGGSQEVGQGVENVEAKLDCTLAMMDEEREQIGNLEHEVRGKEREKQEIPNNDEERENSHDHTQSSENEDDES